MMIKLCAFADEAESSLVGQIAALKRNNIPYLELRSIAGKNVRDFSLDEAREYAKIWLRMVLPFGLSALLLVKLVLTLI